VILRRAPLVLVLVLAAAHACGATDALAQAPRRADPRAPESRTLTSDEIRGLVDDGLASEDARFAEDAIERLRLAGPRVLVPVCGALVRKTPLRRRRAAVLLGRLGDPAAIDPLAGVLGDARGDDDLLLAVGEALIALGSKEGVRPLIDLLESGDRRMRLDAFLVLRRATHHAFNFEHDGPASARATSVAQWRAYWNAERERFVVERAVSPPARLPPAAPIDMPVPPPLPPREPAAATPTTATSTSNSPATATATPARP